LFLGRFLIPVPIPEVEPCLGTFDDDKTLEDVPAYFVEAIGGLIALATEA
jgi:hypothetical protein